MDSIDSENINEAEPDFAERKQQALFLSDPAEEVIKELEAENAELKAELEASVQRYKLHQHLWVDAETEVDELKDLLLEAISKLQPLRVVHPGHMAYEFSFVDKQKHDEWIIKANQAIGDKK